MGDVSGLCEMKCNATTYIAFQADQTPGDTHTMSTEEAVAYGFVDSTTNEAAADVELFKGGMSVSRGTSDTHTYGGPNR